MERRFQEHSERVRRAEEELKSALAEEAQEKMPTDTANALGRGIGLAIESEFDLDAAIALGGRT